MPDLDRFQRHGFTVLRLPSNGNTAGWIVELPQYEMQIGSFNYKPRVIGWIAQGLFGEVTAAYAYNGGASHLLYSGDNLDLAVTAILKRFDPSLQI